MAENKKKQNTKKKEKRRKKMVVAANGLICEGLLVEFEYGDRIPGFCTVVGSEDINKHAIYGKYNIAFFFLLVISSIYWSLTFKWLITLMVFGLLKISFNC